MFSIGQVSRLTNIKEHNIRTWQAQLPFIKISTGKGGRRYYNRKAIEQLVRVNYLIRNMKLKVNGIKNMSEYDPESITRIHVPDSAYPTEKQYKEVEANKYLISSNNHSHSSSTTKNHGISDTTASKAMHIIRSIENILYGQ